MSGRFAGPSAGLEMSKLAYPLGAVAFGLLIWQGLVLGTGAPHFILPSPWRVAQAGWDNHVLIAENAVVTETEVALGLLLGTVLGAFTAGMLAPVSQACHAAAAVDPSRSGVRARAHSDLVVWIWDGVQGHNSGADHLLPGHKCIL